MPLRYSCNERETLKIYLDAVIKTKNKSDNDRVTLIIITNKILLPMTRCQNNGIDTSNKIKSTRTSGMRNIIQNILVTMTLFIFESTKHCCPNI